MNVLELGTTLEKLHDPYFTKQALIELKECYTFAWFSYHQSVGLIVWWPSSKFAMLPIPESIRRMSSYVYFFDMYKCVLSKSRDGMMNFAVPKEVSVLQIMLS